ncbi:MAG: DUF6442 family protein [Lachnospiraceae bacterium]
MNKEEVLAKSRSENKEQDLYEKEVMIKAGNAAAITAAIVASIFFIIQILVGLGMNYGLYAIVFAILTAGFIVKSIYLKRRHEIIVAMIYMTFTLFFSISHIYHLIVTSTIL